MLAALDVNPAVQAAGSNVNNIGSFGFAVLAITQPELVVAPVVVPTTLPAPDAAASSAVGAIVGGVLGGIALVLIIVYIVRLVDRRYPRYTDPARKVLGCERPRVPAVQGAAALARAASKAALVGAAGFAGAGGARAPRGVSRVGTHVVMARGLSSFSGGVDQGANSAARATTSKAKSGRVVFKNDGTVLQDPNFVPDAIESSGSDFAMRNPFNLAAGAGPTASASPVGVVDPLKAAAIASFMGGATRMKGKAGADGDAGASGGSLTAMLRAATAAAKFKRPLLSKRAGGADVAAAPPRATSFYAIGGAEKRGLSPQLASAARSSRILASSRRLTAGAGALAPLAAGWEEAHDEAGAAYYFNEAGETVWCVPVSIYSSARRSGRH